MTVFNTLLVNTGTPVEVPVMCFAGTPINTSVLAKAGLSLSILNRAIMKLVLSGEKITNSFMHPLTLLSSLSLVNSGLMFMTNGGDPIQVQDVATNPTYINDILISGLAADVLITQDEYSVHDTLSFTSTDPGLYALCDPDAQPGVPTIEILVAGQMVQFILLERTGDSTDFSVSAISVSALEDAFADDMNFVLEDDTLASVVAASLLTTLTITWAVEDYVVPAGFSFTGKPIEGIVLLASAVGAVVRVQNDGTLIARNVLIVTSSRHSVSAEIYLDGRPLSERVSDPIVITYDESNVHNSLSFSSSDPSLYPLCAYDYMGLIGESRIEVHVGTRVMKFIIVERNGEDVDFSIDAISESAKEDEFADDIEFELTEPKLASAIASELSTFCAVTWSCMDWVVPVGFSFSGKPIDGIMILAAEIGAVVRCQDDGSLLVRKRRAVRPVDLFSATAAIEYDESDLLVMSHSEEAGGGKNAVEVTGWTDDSVFMPSLRVEPKADGSSPGLGEEFYLQVFWAGRTPVVSSTFITDGEMELADGGFFTESTETETVEFRDGLGTVSLPIKSVQSVTWIGIPGGTVTTEPYSTELTITDSPGFRIAEVVYVTEYQRYLVFNHAVPQLIAVLFLAYGTNIFVTVKTADSEDDAKYMSPITAQYLTTVAAAVERGTAEIDSQKYREAGLSIEAPYEDTAIDGVIAHVNDPHIKDVGNYYVTAVSINIEGPRITNTLQVKKCLL